MNRHDEIVRLCMLIDTAFKRVSPYEVGFGYCLGALQLALKKVLPDHPDAQAQVIQQLKLHLASLEETR
jgi:hypothetical protein